MAHIQRMPKTLRMASHLQPYIYLSPWYEYCENAGISVIFDCILGGLRSAAVAYVIKL